MPILQPGLSNTDRLETGDAFTVQPLGSGQIALTARNVTGGTVRQTQTATAAVVIVGPFDQPVNVSMTASLGPVSYSVVQSIASDMFSITTTATLIANPTPQMLADTVNFYVVPGSPPLRYQSSGSAMVAVGNGGAGAPLNSPVFTGDPQAPTPSTSDNDTSIATTAFVKAAIAAAAGGGGGTGTLSLNVHGDSGFATPIGQLNTWTAIGCGTPQAHTDSTVASFASTKNLTSYAFSIERIAYTTAATAGKVAGCLLNPTSKIVWPSATLPNKEAMKVEVEGRISDSFTATGANGARFFMGVANGMNLGSNEPSGRAGAGLIKDAADAVMYISCTNSAISATKRATTISVNDTSMFKVGIRAEAYPATGTTVSIYKDGVLFQTELFTAAQSPNGATEADPYIQRYNGTSATAVQIEAAGVAFGAFSTFGDPAATGGTGVPTVWTQATIPASPGDIVLDYSVSKNWALNSTTITNAQKVKFLNNTDGGEGKLLIRGGYGSGAYPAFAAPWVVSDVVALNEIRNAGGNLYVATSSTGTTASSGSGPTGTGTAIADGTVTWNYVSAGTGLLQGWTFMQAGGVAPIAPASTADALMVFYEFRGNNIEATVSSSRRYKS